jgi:hypothetical protein
MARSRFTAANAAYIAEQVRKGRSLAEVCEELDLRLKTVEGWLTRGRKEIEALPYANFAAAVDQARIAAAQDALGRDDFETELAKAVRKGSVQALKLWWQVHGTKAKEGDDPEGAGEGDDEEDPFAALDE